MGKSSTLPAPLKLGRGAARLLSVLVLGGLAIGYLGGAIVAGPDGDLPPGLGIVRLVGLISAVVLFVERRGQLAQAEIAMLDERERALRNHSHAATYQIMLATMFGFLMWSIIAKLTGGWMPNGEQAIDLLSGFAIGSMALPGIIMAWREPPISADD